MKMVIKLGMLFSDNNVPDFGSIETGVDGALTLLDADKSKLNSLLTRSGLASYLTDGNFNIGGGTCAVVADAPAVWRYHASTDKWYEILPCDCGEYRVYFYNGSDLADIQTVAEGKNAVYGGETPTKPEDEQYTYTFAGWNSDPSAQTADSDALKSVYANRTVYAVFTANEKTFTVTFKNDTETVYTASSVAYDGTAVYGGETPTKPDDEQYSYTFAGWNADPEAAEADENALKNVRSDRTVFAVFTAAELPENEPGE